MTLRARFAVQRQDFSLDVDLRLPGRGITGIYGPSGSGKTTLLRAIAGLDRHAGGELQLGDSLWQSAQTFVPPHRRALGYVFQEASLFDHLDVLGNLQFGHKRTPESQQRLTLDTAIAMLGIGHLLHRRPATLSGGERQRVALARALANSPQLLLMDEPLSGLDQSSKREILPYLQTLHDELEIPAIYVSHAADEIAQLSDHMVMLENGRVTASGEPQALFSRVDLPLAHEPDAATLIDTVVTSQDEDFGLTHLSFAGGEFLVARQPVAPGSPVRLRLAARDVSLTLERQSHTSILNIFAATVDSVSEESSGQVTVRLLVAGIPILSRITRKSACELKLAPGMQVYAQVKGVAFLT